MFSLYRNGFGMIDVLDFTDFVRSDAASSFKEVEDFRQRSQLQLLQLNVVELSGACGGKGRRAAHL